MTPSMRSTALPSRNSSSVGSACAELGMPFQRLAQSTACIKSMLDGCLTKELGLPTYSMHCRPACFKQRMQKEWMRQASAPP